VKIKESSEVEYLQPLLCCWIRIKLIDLIFVLVESYLMTNSVLVILFSVGFQASDALETLVFSPVAAVL